MIMFTKVALTNDEAAILVDILRQVRNAIVNEDFVGRNRVCVDLWNDEYFTKDAIDIFIDEVENAKWK